MNNESRISISSSSPFARLFETDAEKIERLEEENFRLREELLLEQRKCYNLDRKISELNDEIEALKTQPKRRRRTKEELSALGEKTISEYKTDGKRKARPADSIRSYEDFRAIQKYFWDRHRIRDWMMWTIGVSLGLRISDLFALKMHDLLNSDKSFRDRIKVVEQKTGKANNCLITESVVFAVRKYLDSIKWDFQMDDYLFMSKKTKSKMYEEYGWKILSDAGKALGLPIVIGSHTMRKSFANIAACVDSTSIDMNAITKIQGLLNHSDQKVTMRYLGTYQTMFDNARKSVSDFVLGKTNVHELVAGKNIGLSDVIVKLDQLLENNKL